VYLSPNANFADGLEDGDQLQATLWVRWETDAGNRGSVISAMNQRLQNDFVYAMQPSNPAGFTTEDVWQSMTLTMPIMAYQDAGPPAKVDFGIEWDNAAEGTCLVLDDLSLVRTPR
jgi:hypothetical protein